MKGIALMILANAVYTEALTEDQALGVLLAMDESSEGNTKQLEKHTKSITPIMKSLGERYVAASKTESKK